MTRLLVYNRGEIAVRACLAARGLGLHVILFVTPDECASPAARVSDELYVAHGVEPARAYLDLALLGRAIAETRASHVYPGYGFLSEAPELARSVREAGAVFIGPNEEVLALMAHKERAQSFAVAAGLPHLGVPLWLEGDDPRLPAGTAFPLLLKAAAGGGGRGNLVVNAASELAARHAELRARALQLFACGDLLAERYLARARHVELQVFGTRQRVVVLGTRDCSAQRRHQKLVEEGPASPVAEQALAPHLPRICRALHDLGYRGAGTLEFLFDAERGELHFMEMNTRIQVEHTVTELLIGVDLVALQLREACELEPEPEVAPLSPRGHAIELRLCAEDARNGFLPDTGLVHCLELPRLPFVRWDAGVAQGGHVSPHFDSMIAKLIVWGRSREEALGRAALALDHTHVHGVTTNLDFLRALVSHRDFVADEHDTGWVERVLCPLFGGPPPPGTGVEAELLPVSVESTQPRAGGEGRSWKLGHRS
jgi:acetyl/propionyl-CoA carboxylase alpha subunit